jgi:hypothetical protein
MTELFKSKTQMREELIDIQAGNALGFYMMLSIMTALMLIAYVGVYFERLDAKDSNSLSLPPSLAAVQEFRPVEVVERTPMTAGKLARVGLPTREKPR